MKKLLKKVSKKSILIASILIVLIGVPVLAYLFTREQTENTAAWFNSNWQYRKAINIENPGSTVINEDVLLVIDTQTLIGANKLQSDCDDLRFVNSDDNTILSYWIEGGCNTTVTNVWVRIPSLTGGGHTIYSYYGNPSATNGEASWSGNFYALADSSCNNGWIRDSNFDSKFIYGSTTGGITGGTNSLHGGSFSVISSTTNSIGGVGSNPNQYLCLTTTNHTHEVEGNYSFEDSTPPYISIFMCSKDKLTYLNNLIMLTDSSVPSGWTRFSALDGKFPYGANSYGTTGGSASHSHTYSNIILGSETATNCRNFETPGQGSVYLSHSTHSHTTTSGTTTTASNYPPYIRLLYIKAPSSLITLDQQVISMTSAVPPLGWNQYPAANNTFVMGHTSVDTTVLGSTTHNNYFNLGSAQGSYELFDRNDISAPLDYHSHTVALQDSNIPPYRSVVYAKRKISKVATEGTEEVYNTPPSAPTSLLIEGQTNPSRVTDLTPEFSAIFNDPDTGDTGVFYQIQVNTSSAFNGISMWDSGKTSISPIANGNRSSDISYNGTPLSLNGETYYWRIKFWDQNDINNESPWSAAAAFTMNGTPTEPTDLLTESSINPIKVTESSINPIKVYDTTPEFSAVFNDPDTGDTAIHYQIQVSTVSNFTSTLWDSNQTSISAISNGARSPDISYGGTPLALDGTLYYWRIKFWDQAGTESPWSSTATFRMSANPYAPIDLKVDGRTNPSLIGSARPTFYATHRDPNEDNAIFFEINVNSNASFSGTVKWNTGKVSISPVAHGTEFTVTYGGTQLLGNGTTYYWRIRFWDVDDNVSPWSATATFVDLFNYTRMNGIGLDGLRIN